MCRILHYLLAINILLFVHGSVLEQVDDTDLMHLLTGQDYVVVLFTKSNCPKCIEYETIVENMQQDLKETLGAVVVQAQNSHLITIYNPSKEPSIIYFRHGIPLLYYGDLNEDEILQTFSENKDPIVKELSDENFEHLTQASTGATTGDWFVFFYSADCVFCQRLYAVWEAVGSKLKHRLNVARVNRLEAGISTGKRFRITSSPEFIILRQGKVYWYKEKEYTAKSLIEFAENGYRKQTHPESVPPVSNVMDDLINKYVEMVAKNPQFLLFASLAISATMFIYVICKRLSRKTPQRKEQQGKKSKKAQ